MTRDAWTSSVKLCSQLSYHDRVIPLYQSCTLLPVSCHVIAANTNHKARAVAISCISLDTLSNICKQQLIFVDAPKAERSADKSTETKRNHQNVVGCDLRACLNAFLERDSSLRAIEVVLPGRTYTSCAILGVADSRYSGAVDVFVAPCACTVASTLVNSGSAIASCHLGTSPVHCNCATHKSRIPNRSAPSGKRAAHRADRPFRHARTEVRVELRVKQGRARSTELEGLRIQRHRL
eukprot:6186811-Pleurochrysis_carterae.AAC.1